MAPPTLPFRDGFVARQSTPGPLCGVVPGFLVINGPQTIGITQLCYSIHFRTSNNGQAVAIWHNWAPFLTNAVYCLLTSAVEMAFAQNSVVHRYEYSSWLLLRLNKSIIRNSSGLTDGGYGIEGDKVSAVSSTLSLPGAEKASVKALGWLWYFHPSSVCPDLDSIRPSKTGGQQERREERPLPHADLHLCLDLFTTIFCCNCFCPVFDTIHWHLEAMLRCQRRREQHIRICFAMFSSLAPILFS